MRRLHYELSGGNTRGRFSITSQNGRGLITVAQPLDYKQEKRYILTVTATDSGGRHDTATVYVNVSDANNFAPVFENAPYSASVSVFALTKSCLNQTLPQLNPISTKSCLN